MSSSAAVHATSAPERGAWTRSGLARETRERLRKQPLHRPAQGGAQGTWFRGMEGPQKGRSRETGDLM